MSAHEVLTAVADVLLPGDGPWPPAGALGLGAAMADVATRDDATRAVVDAFLAAPPRALTGPAADEHARTAALIDLETADPATFGVLRALAYETYYTHPDVQAVLAERCGFRPGPAQPRGYPQVFTLDIPPDLDGVRARGPRWRDDGTPTSAAVRAAQESDPDRQWSEEEIWQWRP